MTPDQSLAWLAGLLEGEGYFGTIINRVAGRAYRYPRIGVNMTDADVIGRVASLWGVSVYVMRPAGLSKKTAYRTIILGSRAAIWMRQLYPFMGARRREQIDRAIAEWEALPRCKRTTARMEQHCRKKSNPRWERGFYSNCRFRRHNLTQCVRYAAQRSRTKRRALCTSSGTDSETWFGKIHPMQALAQYREKMGIRAKLIVVGMTSNGFSIADPEDAGALDVVGFDSAMPVVMADFVRT